MLVVDVGTVIEVYAEFSRTGGTYTPFPDPRSHRLQLADLARPEVRERLHRIWTEPDSLNPARISAQVTREVAQLLALLCNYWLMPCFFPATRTQLRYRLQCLATMLDALHAPVFDQHLIDLATDGMMAFAGDSSGKVVAQDVEAGTSAAYGTIITLTMDSGEDTTNDAPTVTEEIDPANEEG